MPEGADIDMEMMECSAAKLVRQSKRGPYRSFLQRQEGPVHTLKGPTGP